MSFPQIRWTVLDAEDVRGLADFYRDLFGLTYQSGHETPEDGEDWLKLEGPSGPILAFQKVDQLEPSTWPDDAVPMQLHLDTTVDSFDELEIQRDRALALGARILLDRSDDPEEALYVFADPAGHPFCIFVA